MFRRKKKKLKGYRSDDGTEAAFYDDADPGSGWRETGWEGEADEWEDREPRRGFLWRLLGLD